MNSVIVSTLLLGTLGALCGILLSWAAGKFQITVDPRIAIILKALPGTNCGACGYPNCSAAAEAVVKGKAQPNVCLVGGKATENDVCKILAQNTPANPL
jgi:RnfABCDGE-type electron transport complex B subunit